MSKPVVGFVSRARRRRRANGWGMPARLSLADTVQREKRLTPYKAAGIVVAESPATIAEALMNALRNR